MARRLIVTICVGLSVAGSFYGCAKPSQPLVEAPPIASASPASQPETPAPTARAEPGSKPNLAQIRDAVQRVFEADAVVDTSTERPFMLGDYNGDGSEDVAVVLRPAQGRVARLNREIPNWIARDLSRGVLPSPAVAVGAQVAGPPPVRIGQDEVLLAIIHGYGDTGWRDESATQTYLLVNAVGTGMRAQSPQETSGLHKRGKIPRISGDVIAQTLFGQAGFIYYSGAYYRWYDPKRYKPDQPARLVHSGTAISGERPTK